MEGLCPNCFSFQYQKSGCPVCGYIKPEQPEGSQILAEGTMLANRYIIGCVLGIGGFGITYKAFDNLLKECCAVKEFAPVGLFYRTPGETAMQVSESVAGTWYRHGLQRFIEEAQTLKRLENISGVVEVKECFQANNTAYFTMELLEGVTLKKIIRNTGGAVDFEDLTIEFYNDFRSFLTDKEYSPNTIARMVKICKTICYAAEQLKLMDAANVRFGFDVIYKDVDNVYLTEERIQELYEYDLSNRPAWEKIKDVFVVGCLTGQRVSDYKRINSKMIVTLTDGNKYIKLKQEKTGNIVYIPLDYRVAAILDKYNGTLPKVYDQKINDHIKEIGEALGWTEIVELDEQRGAMEYTAKKRFCDLLKTHTCRRSLATNMYKAGASLSSIMAITGHNSEQQLKTYLKLDESEKSMLAAKENYFTKLRIAK